MIPYKNIGKHSLLSRYRFFFECMTPWISGPSTTDGARKLRTGQTKILTRESSLRKFLSFEERFKRSKSEFWLNVWFFAQRNLSHNQKCILSPRNEFCKSLFWSLDFTNTGITRDNHAENGPPQGSEFGQIFVSGSGKF